MFGYSVMSICVTCVMCMAFVVNRSDRHRNEELDIISVAGRQG